MFRIKAFQEHGKCVFLLRSSPLKTFFIYSILSVIIVLLGGVTKFVQQFSHLSSLSAARVALAPDPEIPKFLPDYRNPCWEEIVTEEEKTKMYGDNGYIRVKFETLVFRLQYRKMCSMQLSVHVIRAHIISLYNRFLR